MPATPEDQRNAANIYASLSSYVITASLGVIAAQAALSVFVLDKREQLTWFYVFLFAGLLANVLSIVFGGKGVATIASKGFAGNWSLKPNHDYFNYQAILCLLGVGFLLISLFCGTTKKESPKAQEEIQKLRTTVNRLETELCDIQSKYVELFNQIKSIRQPPCKHATSTKRSRPK